MGRRVVGVVPPNVNEPRAATGSVIRFLWSHDGSHVPLWEAGSVLPEDERWLRDFLGLRDSLVGELKAWTTDRDGLGSRRGGPDAMAAIHARADRLVATLNSDLEARFSAQHVH